MQPKGLAEWLEHWTYTSQGKVIDLGLERIGQVVKKMGWEIKVPIFLVGGTNGKGSTCAFLSSIYRQAGYRVGTFFSPHLWRYNERICIDGQAVSDEVIIAAFEMIECKRGGVELTFFEVNTLAAMLIFLAQHVEVIILEVGMGGRLDAVNVFEPDVSIVTNVHLDHQEYLGDTREEIGYEKAGIFRAKQPAIVGEKDPPRKLLEHIATIGAVEYRLGIGYSYKVLGEQWSFYFHPIHEGGHIAHQWHALPLPILRGSYQLANAAVALCALSCLYQRLPVNLGAIKKGLINVVHPGRFQILPNRPMVVLDVGHNPHAISELKKNLAFLPFAPKKIAVFSMLADKDIRGVVRLLKNEFQLWCIATLNTERALPCARIREILISEGITSVESFASIKDAYHYAKGIVSPEDQIVVFGSFFTVSEIMDA